MSHASTTKKTKTKEFTININASTSSNPTNERSDGCSVGTVNCKDLLLLYSFGCMLDFFKERGSFVATTLLTLVLYLIVNSQTESKRGSQKSSTAANRFHELSTPLPLSITHFHTGRHDAPDESTVSTRIYTVGHDP
jgi:hypothetical protein